MDNKEIYDDAWNEDSVIYLSNSAGAKWFKYLLSLCLDSVDAQSVQTIADFGCGIGMKSAQIATRFPSAEVYGYDFSDKGIALAAEYYKDVPNLTFSTNDITEKTRHSFDMICAFEVLEHIEHWEEMADKLITLSNRYILVSFPTGRMRKYELHTGHFRNYKRGQFEGFMESRGWVTVKSIYAGFPFYSPIIRDITNLLYDENKPLTKQHEMSFLTKFLHKIWYFLFRYLSSKRIGDQTLLLFAKAAK